MSKTTLLLIFILLCLVGVTGYNYFVQPFKDLQVAEIATASPSPVAPAIGSEEYINDQVNKIMSDLSTPEKVAQMLALPVGTPMSSPSAEWITTNKPGFVTIFGSSISTTAAQLNVEHILVSSAQARWSSPSAQVYQATLKPWLAVDHEGGTVQRLSGEGFTRLPSWQQLCAEDATVSGQVQRQSALELSHLGINLVLAPVVDVARNHPILKTRICSDDPGVVAQRAAETIDIYTQAGVMPTLKHFPGIGKTTKDLHFQFDQTAVASADAMVYRDILDNSPEIAVMTTHVGVINQDPLKPCSLSVTCVDELKRNYPQVLVVSDALDMRSALNATDRVTTVLPAHPISQVSLAAVAAGNEVLLFGAGVTSDQVEKAQAELVANYGQSAYYRDKIDTAVRKILRYKVRQASRSSQSSN